MKKDFEDKMSMVDSLRNEYEVDKDHALEALREEHRRELERVHLSQVEQESDLSGVKRHLEEMYERDVNQLKQRLDDVTLAKKTLTAEYEEKMAKAKAFYASELEVLQKSQDSERQNDVVALEERFNAMKKELELVEMTSQQMIDALMCQLAASEGEVGESKCELDELRDSVRNNVSESGRTRQEVCEWMLMGM